MKKIYFFLPDYPDWTSGGHKYHTILFEYFKKKNKNVYTFGHNKRTKNIENNKFLKIVYGLIYSGKIPAGSVVVQSNTSFLHCFLPVLFNKVWKNHYYFLIIHHLVRDEKPSYLRKKLEDYFIKKADKIVTISETTRKRLYDLNLGLKDIEIINPGLDVEKYPETFEKKFPDKLKLLYVGAIDERKGIKYLIESLSMINCQDFELNLIGSETNGEYYKSVLETTELLNLKNKVNFLGNVGKEELKSFFLNSSVFVFPSLWEGYGMVIAEAMAYGLPVIASKIPAIQELITDNVNGLLVDVKSPEQIAEKINLLASDKILSKKISENAFKRSASFPGWEDVSERIYRSVSEI